MLFRSLLLLATAATVVCAEEPARTIYNDKDYTSFPNQSIAVVVPDGFEPAKEAGSFSFLLDPAKHPEVYHALLPLTDDMKAQLREKAARIVASVVPGPYAEVIKVFTAEELAARHMDLESKDSVTVDGRPGLLLKVAVQAGDNVMQQWTLVSGDYKESYTVSAVFPADAEALSAPLRNAVLSARWKKSNDAEDPFKNLRFSVQPGAKLRHADFKEAEDLVIFTSDGLFPLSGPGEPLFVAGYEMNQEKIKGDKDFALQKLKSVPHCTEVKPGELTSITLDGLKGYEATADAKDESSGNPVRVYQALLFSSGYHIFLLGVVDAARAEEFLPEFKAAAHSFKQK